MKSLLSQILIGVLGCVGLSAFVYASNPVESPAKIHHFTIIAPPTAKVGEAIDITVEARDKSDAILSSYRGSVYFQSDTDFGATLPAQGRAIQFKESDNGVLKISKGVTFKRVGDQELVVSEAIEDVGGKIKIRVEESGSGPVTSPTESITITTPEKGSTVTNDTIMMSGKTKKNSKVSIKLNTKELGTTQSNEDGIFTYKIAGIDQQANALSVSVLDGSNAVLGTAETSFSYGVRTPTYYNVTITPAKEVDAGTGVVFLIDAEPALAEVTILLDGTLLTAKEQSPGKYSITTTSPKKSGAYPIEIKLKNVLTQVTTKTNADTLTVKEPVVPKVSFKNVTLTAEGARINLNFFVENLPASVTEFKIAYGETAETLSNEVTTYALDKIKKPDGSYNWYIDNLPPKTYSFKIFGAMSGGVILSDFVSDPQSATVGKSSCSIGDIKSITTATASDKTVLSWEALSGALSYNVYRISASKDYELVKNVTEPSYTIYLSSGALEYQDFAVRALCDDMTESSVPAVASRVQTGPGILTIIVVLSSLLSILFIRRKWA